MIVKNDCKYFPGDRPCKYHKSEKVICDNCGYYSPAGKLILIIKLDAIGDVLRTTSLLHSLKEKYNDSYIYWITKSNATAIFKGNEFVDEVIAYEDQFLNSFLSSINFDIVINLDPSVMSASLASYAKAENKIGFGLNTKGKVFPFNKEAEEWFDMGAFDNIKAANKKSYQQIIHEICSLEYKKGKIIFNLDELEIENAKKFCMMHSLKEYNFIVGINPGASDRWQFKKWRKDGYIELIKKLEKHNCGILLFGGRNEVELVKELKYVSKNVFETGNDNSLRFLAAYINLVDVMITGDTLALHVATALEKNTICIFGPTSYNEIEDYGLITKIYPELDCLVCYKNKCDFVPNCMELITSEMIYDTLITILKNNNKIK